MRRFQVLSICVTFMASLVQAHMEMKKPSTRRSKFNPSISIDQIDYSLSSPLGSSYPFPCRGAPKGNSVASYRAGENVQVELHGQAIHNGGHCQFAVSYDEGITFVVLRTIMKTCMLDGLNFDVPIPESAPSSSNVIFAWTWINRTGNREYYMNCADITIVGKKNAGSIVGPKLLVANLPNSPSIPEFINNGYDGSDLFEKRPIITIRNVEPVKSSTSTVASTPTRESAKNTSTPSLSATEPGKRPNPNLKTSVPSLPLSGPKSTPTGLPTFGSPPNAVIEPSSEAEAKLAYKLKKPKVMDFLTTAKEDNGVSEPTDDRKNDFPFTRIQLKSHKFLDYKARRAARSPKNSGSK